MNADERHKVDIFLALTPERAEAVNNKVALHTPELRLYRFLPAQQDFPQEDLLARRNIEVGNAIQKDPFLPRI